MNNVNNLKIYRKVEVLIDKVYPRIRKFPRSEIHGLSLHIKKALFDLLEKLSLANAVRSKRKHYAFEADAALHRFRSLFRLARRSNYLSKGFYEDVSLDITEISKMLTGYIKTA